MSHNVEILTSVGQPLLIIFGGLPGTGKSTLARMLAEHLKAVYVRVDTLEQLLIRRQCFTDDTVGYGLAYSIAADNLRVGHIVVADSVNPVKETREGWRAVAQDNYAQVMEIEIICSDSQQHQNRVETRTADIPNHTLPTWQDVITRDYQPWPTKTLTIDSAYKSVAATFHNLIQQFQHYAHTLENDKLV